MTVSRMDIIAAVGEPDGRKANWLENAKLTHGKASKFELIPTFQIKF